MTAIEDGEMLGVFGTLHVATAAAARPARTRAAITAVDARAGAIELTLGGEAPGGAPLEWQVRLDDGLWSPYSPSPVLRLERAALQLQGTHSIEVRAREVGAPLTTDPQPVRLEVVTDALPPVLSVRASGDGVLVDARDAISPRQTLALRYRLDGGAWHAAGAPPVALELGAAAHLEVVATDEAGKSATWSGPIVGFHGAAEGSGCDCSSAAPHAGGLLIVASVGLLLVRRRRRPGRLLSILVVVVALGAAGGGCGGDDRAGEPDAGPPEPIAVEPGPTGRWASMAGDDTRVLLAGYETRYGDLVVAELRAEGEPRWQVIDGVPEGPVVLDPDGYRGGITAPGDDVGAWTSIGLHHRR